MYLLSQLKNKTEEDAHDRPCSQPVHHPGPSPPRAEAGTPNPTPAPREGPGPALCGAAPPRPLCPLWTWRSQPCTEVLAAGPATFLSAVWADKRPFTGWILVQQALPPQRWWVLFVSEGRCWQRRVLCCVFCQQRAPRVPFLLKAGGSSH